MNTLLADIKTALAAEFSTLNVSSQYDTEEKELPSILLESEIPEEKIRGNFTWHTAITITLTANAHDEPNFDALFTQLRTYIQYQLSTNIQQLPDKNYLLYSLCIESISTPTVNDDELSQSILLTSLIQQ